MSERKIIVLTDKYGVIKRVALTEEQISFLNWLSENDWLYEGTTYEKEGKEVLNYES
jgi:hypothetical protein